jgi:hypothetical protein
MSQYSPLSHMPTNPKIFCLALITTVLVSGLLFINEAQGTNVASLISTDTTWTAAGSPYTLTGPTAIKKGTTLTIEAGVTVNINDYYIQVNGTLSAKGQSNQRININGGQLIFTAVSNGWNQQSNTGNILEFATIDQTEIRSDNALKLNGDIIKGSVAVGDNSVLTNNEITYQYAIVVGASSTITGNTINALLQTKDHTTISRNIIKPQTSADNGENPAITTWNSCTITDNTITGYRVFTMWAVYNNAIKAGHQTVIANNKIDGIISGAPSEIRGNIIEGGAISDSWSMMDQDRYVIYAISIDADTKSTIISNAIRGTAGGAVSAKSVTFTSNNVFGNVEASDNSEIINNIISGHVLGGGVFQNNRIINGGITLGSVSTVTDNSIEYGGIHGAAGTIRHNQISNADCGIETGSEAVNIQANTLTKNKVGIDVQSNSATIAYNNIEGCTEKSLKLSTASNLNAANNWWGTTDKQAIGDSIYDFKNDFNIGTVEIGPILEKRNAEAASEENLNLPSDEPITSTSTMHLPTFSFNSASPTQNDQTHSQSETGNLFLMEAVIGVSLLAIAVLAVFGILIRKKFTKKDK